MHEFKERCPEEMIPFWNPEFLYHGRTQFYISDGWIPLVLETHRKLAELNPEYRIDQIKEKFGGLRYYVKYNAGGDNQLAQKMNDIITEAEDRSYRICDVCGSNQGYMYLVHSRILATRCEHHSEGGTLYKS